MTVYSDSHPSVLILGGTQEAVLLALKMVERQTWKVITAFAGRTNHPRIGGGHRHIGAFGGIKGLYTYLKTNNIHCVVDATHPFARRISENASLACRDAMVPRICLIRLPWVRHAQDHWIEVSNMEMAISHLPSRPSRIFLTIGRQQLAWFTMRDDLWFLVRLIDSSSARISLTNVVCIDGRGPFDVESERDLLKEYHIDMMVSKNSGGTASYAKILAARSLGVPVIMIAQPAPSTGLKVTEIDQVLTWLESLRKE